MKKKILIVICAILVVALICGGIILKKENEIESNPTIKDVKETIENIELSIENVYRTFNINDKYIAFLVQQSDPESESMDLYIYDISSKKVLDNNISVGAFSEVIGNNENYIYVYEYNKNQNLIQKIEYPSMKKADPIHIDEILGKYSNIIISSDESKIAYCNQDGLYLYNISTGEEKVLIGRTEEQIEDMIAIEINVPIKFIENNTKIVYYRSGYEWLSGVGIVDLEGNNQYYPKYDMEFLKYDNNNMYLKEVYSGQIIEKYNMNNKKEDIIFEGEENEYIVKAAISKDNKKLGIIKDLSTEENEKFEYRVIDIDTKKEIAKYEEEYEMYNSPIDMFFDEDSIIIVTSNSIKIWNY